MTTEPKHHCIKCKEMKPAEDFAKNKDRSNGLQNRCRACQRLMARRHYEANRAAYQERTRNLSPAKRRAHRAVESALSTGRIKRLPCEKCEAIPAEAHHDDYGKPLAVRWLCRSHHQEWHREHGEAPNG